MYQSGLLFQQKISMYDTTKSMICIYSMHCMQTHLAPGCQLALDSIGAAQMSIGTASVGAGAGWRLDRNKHMYINLNLASSIANTYVYVYVYVCIYIFVYA